MWVNAAFLGLFLDVGRTKVGPGLDSGRVGQVTLASPHVVQLGLDNCLSLALHCSILVILQHHHQSPSSYTHPKQVLVNKTLSTALAFVFVPESKTLA